MQEPGAAGLAVRHLGVVLRLHLGEEHVDGDARDVEDGLDGRGHGLGPGEQRLDVRLLARVGLHHLEGHAGVLGDVREGGLDLGWGWVC